MKTTTTTLKKKVNLAFFQPGSKASMITNLLGILPASIDYTKNIKIIEVFCGSAIFSFNMMTHFEKVYALLNDLDEILVKTFLEIKNNSAALLLELDKTNIASETLFNLHVLRKDNQAETDFNRVVSSLYCKFFAMPMRDNAFNSAFRNSCIDKRGIADQNNLTKLTTITKYLQNCILNNRTFDNFLKTIKTNIMKGENTLLFVDPPYLDTKSSSDNNAYQNFNEDDMKRLLDYLDENCKIPFIFCHFPHPIVEEWATKNGHTINKFKKLSNCSNIVNKFNIHKDKEEWFITNYTEFYTENKNN